MLQSLLNCDLAEALDRVAEIAVTAREKRAAVGDLFSQQTLDDARDAFNTYVSTPIQQGGQYVSEQSENLMPNIAPELAHAVGYGLGGAAIGAGVGGLSSLTQKKKRPLSSMMTGALLGGSIGAGGSFVHDLVPQVVNQGPAENKALEEENAYNAYKEKAPIQDLPQASAATWSALDRLRKRWGWDILGAHHALDAVGYNTNDPNHAWLGTMGGMAGVDAAGNAWKRLGTSNERGGLGFSYPGTWWKTNPRGLEAAIPNWQGEGKEPLQTLAETGGRKGLQSLLQDAAKNPRVTVGQQSLKPQAVTHMLSEQAQAAAKARVEQAKTELEQARTELGKWNAPNVDLTNPRAKAQLELAQQAYEAAQKRLHNVSAAQPTRDINEVIKALAEGKLGTAEGLSDETLQALRHQAQTNGETLAYKLNKLLTSGGEYQVPGTGATLNSSELFRRAGAAASQLPAEDPSWLSKIPGGRFAGLPIPRLLAYPAAGAAANYFVDSGKLPTPKSMVEKKFLERYLQEHPEAEKKFLERYQQEYPEDQ